MSKEKKTLTMEQIDAQVALELPDREMNQVLVLPGSLVNVVVQDVQVNVDVDIHDVCVVVIGTEINC